MLVHFIDKNSLYVKRMGDEYFNKNKKNRESRERERESVECHAKRGIGLYRYA